MLRNEGALGAREIGQRAFEELLELDLHLRLDGRGLCARRDAPDEVEPLQISALQQVSVDRGERRHQMDGKPEGRRRGTEALAVEAGRRDADDGDRLAVDGEAGADDGGIAAEFLLPRLEADDGDGRCALHVVGGPQQPSGVRAKAERIEGISGNEFAVPGLRGIIAAGAAHRHLVIRRIQRRRGWRSPECGRETVRIAGRRRATSRTRVLVVGKTAVHAALFVVADAQKGRGILNRQRPKQHGVHQGEDGRGGSDAEREGQDGGEGEAR